MRVEEESLGTFNAYTHLRRLMGFMRGTQRLLLLCVLGSAVGSAIQVVTPLLVRQAVDVYMLGTLPAQARVSGLVWLAWAYAALLALNLFVGYGVAIGLNYVGQNVVRAVRTAVWRHFHRLPIPYFDRNPIGRLVTRVANDTTSLSEVFTSVLATGVSDVLLFFLILGMMATLDVRLTLVLATLFPFLIALTWWFKTNSQRIHRQVRVLVARVNAFFQENVQGIGVVKSFTAEPRMRSRFHDLAAECYRTDLELIHVFAIFRPLISGGSTLSIALMLWVGGRQVLDGALSLGTLVAFLFYVRMLYAPIDELAEKFNLFQEAMVGSERIFRILDTPAEPVPEAIAEAPRAKGHIVFENVSFAYDPEKPVLNGISFEARPGETVALVGPTGSGKTTVTALLLGFYSLGENGGGRILLDGVPLQDWDPRVLRRQFGLVQQDLFLFSADLRQNVTLFSDVSDALVSDALEASQAARVVEKYEQGLAHRLNERGASLSQGERQLLSFARALAVDPPLLILDEATASVDSRTEQLIQEALRRVLAGRTAVVVAHRLSTVQEADRILVLKKGQLVEQGSHSELLAANGLYAHLFRTQQLDPRP